MGDASRKGYRTILLVFINLASNINFIVCIPIATNFLQANKESSIFFSFCVKNLGIMISLIREDS